MSRPSTPRRRHLRAWAAGALPAGVLDLLMLGNWHLGLLARPGLLGSFYDIQARALMAGHLAIPSGSISFEGFVVGGRTYEYFGPVPALLRIPVLALTHSLDGRLTQLSMLLALAVLLAGGAALHWGVRVAMRGSEAPLSGLERAAAVTVAFALGAGGVPLFLSSWPVVYHEAALWGAALSVAALAAVVALVLGPSPRRLAAATALALLAASTRISVGLAAIAALGLLGLAALGHRRWRAGSALIAAALVALAPAVALNQAKFGSPFNVPLDKQLDTGIDPTQRAFVAAYHGATAGLRWMPTDLLAAIRPDAIGTVRAFPFLGLPHDPPTIVGGVRFNALLPSLSAVTSMPLFCLLTLVGLAGLVRGSRGRRLWAPLAGAAIACGPALSFGSTATRYLTDLLPFLLLAACIGAVELTSRGAPRRRPGRWIAVLGALALLGTATNGATGLLQEGLLAPNASTGTRAGFVSLQDHVDRLLGRRPHGVHVIATLPRRVAGAPGDLFILGRCQGLFVRDQLGGLLAVQRGPGAGLVTLVTGDPRGTLVTMRGAGSPPLVVRAVRAGGFVRLTVSIGRRTGPAATVGAGEATRVSLTTGYLGLGPVLTIGVGPHDRAVAALPVAFVAPRVVEPGPGVRLAGGSLGLCRRLLRGA